MQQGRESARGSRWVPAFLPGFAVANLAAFTSFLPLLQILLPLKATEVAPAHPAGVLGVAVAAGAVVAGASNLAVGWLSDRSRSPWGRRRPWIVAGALGVALSYAAIDAASSATALVASVVLFQIAFNTLFAPLLALIPERVAADEQGRAASLVALGHPLGGMIGAVLIGTLITAETTRFGALAAIVVFGLVPFAMTLGADPSVAPKCVLVEAASPRGSGAGRSRDFLLGALARTCVRISFSVTQTFLLFYLQPMFRHGAVAAPHAAEYAVSVLGVAFGIASASAALVLGRVSDRARRRRRFVIAASLTVAAGMFALALAPGWPIALGAYTLFALGAGAHTAVDLAMMIELLPSRSRVGRDLGVLNLSNIAPQVLGPLLTTSVLSIPGADIHWVFAAAGVSAAFGGALVGRLEVR